MVRAVVDTNVIISGLLKSGIPRKIWSAFKSGKCKFVLSSASLRELNAILPRPKFHKLTDEEVRKKAMLYLELFAELIEPPEVIAICRDPADNHILACAQAARANFIVSGDKDSLVLKSLHGIPIIKPRGFLTNLKA